MSSILKCILLLTIANYLPAIGAQRQRNNGMVRCIKEIGKSSSTCEGQFCYKMRTPDDTTKDGIVKKGCMKAADAQTEVGKCTTRPLEEGGAELMCVCRERDFCNFSPISSPIIAVFLTIFVAHLIWP